MWVDNEGDEVLTLMSGRTDPGQTLVSSSTQGSDIRRGPVLSELFRTRLVGNEQRCRHVVGPGVFGPPLNITRK